MLSSATPTVSVIIPAYNRSNVLRYAIQSVLDQTFKDFEVLVVGDACSDDSAQVVSSFNDARLHWFNLEQNSGSQAAPNNFGLQNSSGKYIAYLGQDDLWLPIHLKVLIEKLESTRADLVFSLAELVHPDGERLLSGILLGDQIGPADFVVPSSILHRRSIYQELGGWKDHRTLSIGTDADFLQRALSAGKKLIGADRLTVFKFTSAKRRNSYQIRSCLEQATWYARIKNESEIEHFELLQVIRSYVRQGVKPVRISPEADKFPPGWIISQIRKFRGLDREEPMSVLEMSVPNEAVSLSFINLESVAKVCDAGATIFLEVKLGNKTGTKLQSTGPNPFYLSYKWLDAAGELFLAEGQRSVVFPELLDGQESVYRLVVELPHMAGDFRLRLAAVQEGVRWFECGSPEGLLSFRVVERKALLLSSNG